MLKRLAVAVVFVAGTLAVIAGGLMATNPAPVVPGAEVANDATRPFVVKLHARWCPVCMTTKDVWATVQAEYGDRVRLVVFDFTSDATTEASRREAQRLGLERVFEDYVGETGTVLVLDGATREVKYSLHGDREAAHYRDAISAVLSGDPSRPARRSLLGDVLEDGQAPAHERRREVGEAGTRMGFQDVPRKAVGGDGLTAVAAQGLPCGDLDVLHSPPA